MVEASADSAESKIRPPPGFVNGVLLGRSISRLFTYRPWLLSCSKSMEAETDDEPFAEKVC